MYSCRICQIILHDLPSEICYHRVMFSIAGDLVSVQSANLGCDHVNKLIFLKRVAVFELEDTEIIEKV